VRPGSRMTSTSAGKPHTASADHEYSPYPTRETLRKTAVVAIVM
jgi:hypothetical protein